MAHRSTDQRWSGSHGDAVRGAAPEPPIFTTQQQNALWQQIEGAVHARPRRSRNWKAVVTAFVALGAVGFAGAAVANVLTSHTGKFATDAEDLELGGPGERLNPRGADFAVVLDQATLDIEFPSPQARESALSWEVEDLSDEVDTLVSTGALRLWMAGHALCSWSDAWAVALREGDDASLRHAADVIMGARKWPAITDIDTQLADSEAAWLPVLERAVETGDPAAAKDALDGNGACMPGLAPELGLGQRW